VKSALLYCRSKIWQQPSGIGIGLQRGWQNRNGDVTGSDFIKLTLMGQSPWLVTTVRKHPKDWRAASLGGTQLLSVAAAR